MEKWNTDILLFARYQDSETDLEKITSKIFKDIFIVKSYFMLSLLKLMCDLVWGNFGLADDYAVDIPIDKIMLDSAKRAEQRQFRLTKARKQFKIVKKIKINISRKTRQSIYRFFSRIYFVYINKYHNLKTYLKVMYFSSTSKYIQFLRNPIILFKSFNNLYRYPIYIREPSNIKYKTINSFILFLHSR